MPLLTWLGSNWLRVAAYSVAAAAALLAGGRERRRERFEVDLWPTFWFLTAGLFAAMVVGRATDLGGWASELARRAAVSQGWYNHRLKVQVIVVGSIGATWLVIVVGALFSVPARRRRYLPAALVVCTLMSFAGVRVVSLHQIDAVLDRRQVAGVRVGSLLELAGVAVAIAVTFWQPRSRLVREPAGPPSLVTSDRGHGRAWPQVRALLSPQVAADHPHGKEL